jgi:hypothetical protein
MSKESEHTNLVREAKAIVALAFRNGPIEACTPAKLAPRVTATPAIRGSPTTK